LSVHGGPAQVGDIFLLSQVRLLYPRIDLPPDLISFPAILSIVPASRYAFLLSMMRSSTAALRATVSISLKAAAIPLKALGFRAVALHYNIFFRVALRDG